MKKPRFVPAFSSYGGAIVFLVNSSNAMRMAAIVGGRANFRIQPYSKAYSLPRNNLFVNLAMFCIITLNPKGL